MAANTLTPTSLSAAVTSTSAQTFTCTAVTAAVVGYYAVVDGEVAGPISAIDTTAKTVTVSRGALGTLGATHASGAALYFAQPTWLSGTQPIGPGVSANELALPRIVIDGEGVSIYDLVGATSTTQAWQLLTRNGQRQNTISVTGSPAGADVIYTTLGAITPQPGYVGINGTTLAMTIIDPTVAQEGMIMTIYSVNASAQTLTNSPTGFNGLGSAGDVATYGGAVGDNIVLHAKGTQWWVLSTRGVTLG